MKRLLYIEASPRKKRSSSIEVAHAYLDAYLQRHPDHEVETLDLWHKELPRFDGDCIDAKYAIMHRHALTEAERKSWRAVEQMIDDFKRADCYLFSLPMWNFGIPYQLKHFFDVIVQPSYTFTHSPSTGYQGLVTGKPVVIIYSRGGSYGPGTGGEGFDLQKPYMEAVLKFIGFTDFKSILIEPTMTSQEVKEEVVKLAKEEAVRLATG